MKIDPETNLDLPLGRQTPCPEKLSPEILYRIARPTRAPGMHGYDRWHCYELTWLDLDGKVNFGILTLDIPADSPYLVESKSLKLFLGSMAVEKIGDQQAVTDLIKNTLSSLLQTEVKAEVIDARLYIEPPRAEIQAEWIDDLNVAYDPNISTSPHLLSCEDVEVTESLATNLFRSLCPVTAQPDYATVAVRYSGKQINRESLLRYLISYRKKQDFHESCCEQIFLDMRQACAPTSLSVECLFAKRGGIDICPYRSSDF